MDVIARLTPRFAGVSSADEERVGPRDDVTIGPCEIRKGELVILASWCVHRHEKLWKEPHGFDPTRFGPQRVKARHRCACLPFGAGPGICIGMGSAMMEMIVLLAALLRAFRFKTRPGHRIVLTTSLTIRAKDGLPLLIEPL